jgi:hypothetical protein
MGKAYGPGNAVAIGRTPLFASESADTRDRAAAPARVANRRDEWARQDAAAGVAAR